MAHRMIQRLAGLLPGLLLFVASAIFVHQVSPLRDPSFQPNSGNGGSQLPWMQSVSDGDWMWAATILAALLATNITVVVNQWIPAATDGGVLSGQPRRVRSLIRFVIWGFTLWTLLFAGFWLISIGYLLNQWLID